MTTLCSRGRHYIQLPRLFAIQTSLKTMPGKKTINAQNVKKYDPWKAGYQQ